MLVREKREERKKSFLFLTFRVFRGQKGFSPYLRSFAG
jgi:hypothetical protein